LSSAVFFRLDMLSSGGATATLETGVVQLNSWSWGTAFQLHCGKLTSTLNSLRGSLRRKITQHCDKDQVVFFQITLGLVLIAYLSQRKSSKFYQSWNEHSSPALPRLSIQFSSHSAMQR